MIATGYDERVYNAQAWAIRDRGLFAGYRLIVERFLGDPKAGAYPSPLRWGWLLPLAMVLPLGQRWLTLLSALLTPVVAVWAVAPVVDMPTVALAGLLTASSPLLWCLGRRMLQDVPVAALTLLALGFSFRAEPVSLALSLAALVATKESGALTVPALACAWLASGGECSELAAALVVAGLIWAVATVSLLGRNTVAVTRKALGGHDTEYARAYQRGAWHRLIVDVALVSPLPLLLAWRSHSVLLFAAAMLLAAHMLAPIRNVRFVVAVDPLLRVCAAAAVVSLHAWAAIPLLVIADIAVARRISKIYDPVTSDLARACEMTPRALPT